MSEEKGFGSPARSVLIRVRSLEESKRLYTEGFGLSCIGETSEIGGGAREFWGLEGGKVRCARLAGSGDPYGMIDLVEWSGGSGESVRVPGRIFDFGLLTINWKVGEMGRALERLSGFGAKPVSATKSYEAGGKRIDETMVDLPTGERCTLLQVGDPVETRNPLGEAAATVGTVVESVDSSLPFYRDVLGLRVAVTIDHRGEPFASLLGAPPETHLKMALLAGVDTWTGKLELLQFGLPDGDARPADVNPRADGSHHGYWMVSVSTSDPAAFRDAAAGAGARILRGPVEIDRPFAGRTVGMIVAAPGGESFEVLSG